VWLGLLRPDERPTDRSVPQRPTAMSPRPRSRAKTRGVDRAAAGISALKGEIMKRIEALNALAAEEERCHEHTIAWMADLDRAEPPDNDDDARDVAARRPRRSRTNGSARSATRWKRLRRS